MIRKQLFKGIAYGMNLCDAAGVQSDQMSAAIFLKGIAYEMNLRDAVASA